MPPAVQLSLFTPPVQTLPPTEQEKRDEGTRKIMESEQKRAELLRRASKARHLGRARCIGMMRYRVAGAVTSDMVNDALDIPVMRARTRTRTANNMNGHIFSVIEAGKERFRYLGHVQSKRMNSHANLICAWCLESDYETVKPNWDRVWDERGRPRQ